MKHEIFIYGDIVPFKWLNDGSEYDLKDLRDSLSSIAFQPSDELIVNIHTYGGDTTTAFAIRNLLKRTKTEKGISIRTRVDGYCASSGVIILLAGDKDKRTGSKFLKPFVHNAWSWMVTGDKNEAKKIFEALDIVDNEIAECYAEDTDISKEEALQFMSEDRDLTIEECMKYGFYSELENVQTVQNSMIFNSIISRNKESRNNSINNKMTQEENLVWNKIKNMFSDKDKTSSKNAMLYTDKNEEVVFAELNEGEKPKVGDAATINGKNASGTVNMADGSVYSFEAGKVTEIKEKDGTIDTVTLNSLNEKLDGLISKNTELENTIATQNSTIETLQSKLNKVSDFEDTFNKLKNLVGETGVGVENEPKGPVDTVVTTSKNRFENFKLKNTK
ncbi:Clp protease ClpP [Chryseobacterium sp. PCH239]|uniref:Clp protease ClpP n=1 Tax=Chryseobacterium sp. PCH239 TaxID=2825845 RepID=UPI001C10A290|nr:Clp protease ClpP [Chryseobacterium sp. PCH239]QWT88110.1 Clp protease ClpP [Chryseobacterium sp. PCH239]